MDKINMKDLGLTERFEQEATIYKGLFVGRISSQYKDLYKIITENGELAGEISGKFRYEVKSLSDYPAVGDFVMIHRLNNKEGNTIIHHVLTRKSVFERKAAGTSKDVQVVASNIDTVFICMSLNQDFNLRRLERYLSIAWDSGAVPVVVLTKSDLCNELQQRLLEISTVAIAVDVLVTTSMSEDGYLSIQNYISNGKTVAFIGSSGVGKSTLINRLLGQEIQSTKDIRNDDDKGRHTTTRRELIVLPNGGAVIDTPGMREIGIESADFSKAFSDIEELAAECKYKDCTHQLEPGCAVQQALSEGILSLERLENYTKLKKEAKYEGLNSKQIETVKIKTMFAEVGGIKNARKFVKEKRQY